MKKMGKRELVLDSFEEITLNKIWRDKKLSYGSYQLQDKIVRKGKRAIKITIHEGDNAEPGGSGKMTERDELLERKDLLSKEGKIYRYKFSMFIPRDFPIVPVRLVIAQWKQLDVNNRAKVDNPLIALRYQEGVLRVTLQYEEEKSTLYKTKEEVREKWLDFKFEIKFSKGNDGLIKGWLNKKRIVNYNGQTAYKKEYGYQKEGLFYFKMGLYRDTMKEPMDIYIDEYQKEKIG